MDNKIRIISSTLDDVLDLQSHLRVADIRELEALGSTPSKSLLKGFIYSSECFTVYEGNKVIGIFGYGSWNLPKGFGTIWFLGSEECRNHPITFVKEGIKYVKRALEKYQILINCVDSRNTESIKWLQAIGMSLSSSIKINGNEFIQFYKVRGV